MNPNASDRPAALLDSHAFVWLVTDPAALSPRTRAYLNDPDLRLLLSVASGWELAIKDGLGKLELDIPLRELIVDATAQALVEWLPIRPSHMLRVGSLKLHHRDPFDRMIVAQALVEGVPVVSVDPALDAYGVDRIW